MITWINIKGLYFSVQANYGSWIKNKNIFPTALLFGLWSTDLDPLRLFKKL